MAAPRTWYSGGALYITSAFSTRSTGVFRNKVSNCETVMVVGFPFSTMVRDEAPANDNVPSFSVIPGSSAKASKALLTILCSARTDKSYPNLPSSTCTNGRSAVTTTSCKARSLAVKEMSPVCSLVPVHSLGAYAKCCKTKR